MQAVRASQEQLEKDVLRAVKAGKPARVQELIACGADVNTRNSMVCLSKVYCVWQPSVPSKLKHPHMQNKGETLLSMALQRSDRATAVVLIEAGADVNARDDVRAVRFCMLLGDHPVPGPKAQCLPADR